MKVFRNPVFLEALFLFVVTHFLNFLGFSFAFANAYLDDLVCFPLLLSGILVFHRSVRRGNSTYVLPLAHLVIGVVFYGILFEAILPALQSTSIADPLDVIAYGTGAIIFQVFINVA